MQFELNTILNRENGGKIEEENIHLFNILAFFDKNRVLFRQKCYFCPLTKT